MSSYVGMGNAFLALGSATVRTNVAMPQTNTAAPPLPPKPCLASAPWATSHARRPILLAVCPPAFFATEPETVRMVATSWAALGTPVANTWGISTAPLLPQTFSGLPGAPWLSWDVPGRWTPRTPSPLCCRWTCSWGRETRCMSTTAWCSEQSTFYRYCRIITTRGRRCWSQAADRWVSCTWLSLAALAMASTLPIR